MALVYSSSEPERKHCRAGGPIDLSGDFLLRRSVQFMFH